MLPSYNSGVTCCLLLRLLLQFPLDRVSCLVSRRLGLNFKVKNKTGHVYISTTTSVGSNHIMRGRKYSGGMSATGVGRKVIETITVLF
jgi:hypothetical protein